MENIKIPKINIFSVGNNEIKKVRSTLIFKMKKIKVNYSSDYLYEIHFINIFSGFHIIKFTEVDKL